MSTPLNPWQKRYPLHFAILNQRVEKLGELLKALDPRSSVNELDDDSMTPLMYAVFLIPSTETLVIVGMLIKYEGIDLNVKDAFGNTALHHAVANNNLQAIEQLLNAPGIDIAIKNDEHETPYQHAVREKMTGIIEIFKKTSTTRRNGLFAEGFQEELKF
jgi:ankyrin repeat protein